MTTFPSLDDRLRMALAEDLGPDGLAGDCTAAAIFGDAPGEPARAAIRAKARGVVSGGMAARRVFEILAEEDPLARQGESLSMEVEKPDGDAVEPGDIVLRLRGSARLLLGAERTALNLMQRMSGIATLTRACVAEAGEALRVVDTRKTTPLWRDLEKQAVVDGGGHNHRMGLYDAYMIKDNHIAAAGGIAKAIRRVQGHRTDGREIVVEVRTPEELEAALPLIETDTVLMLDNMRGEELARAIRRVGASARTELSGNYGPGRLADVAAAGAWRVSLGCLTHSAPALDLSLIFNS